MLGHHTKDSDSGSKEGGGGSRKLTTSTTWRHSSGSSIIVVIPKELAKKHGLDKPQTIVFEDCKDCIKIRPLSACLKEDL